MSTTTTATVTRPTQRAYPAYAHGLARRVLLTREMAVVAGLLVVYIWSWFNVAYFDQLRHQLDLEKTVIDNVAEGRDFIDIDGQSRHVLSYLGDFLFSPQRARTPVKALSGGERARLLLAKLFSKPANLLVLDEPTNDLDVETLSSLENALLEFPGAAVVVSHDRWFLDRVATHILAYEGDSKWYWFEGNFESYEKNKVERLGPDAARPHRATYKKLTRG